MSSSMSSLSSPSSSSFPSPHSGSMDGYEGAASSWRALDLPSSMVHKEGKFRNARGQNLSYIALFPSQSEDDNTTGDESQSHHSNSNEAPPPQSPKVRGAVVFLHGIFEHSRRFFQLYEQLCENGFCVLAYDLISHGVSDTCEHKRRGHARRFQYFVNDTNDFVAFAKRSILPEMLQLQPKNNSDHPTLPPIIISGTSFGSLIAIHTVLSGKHTFAGITLASPMFTFEWTPTLRLQSVLASPVSAIAPKLALGSAKRYELLCRDQAFVDDLMNDPLVTKGNLTARMSSELIKASVALQSESRIMGNASSDFAKVPVLFMMGGADQLTSVPQTVEFFERMQSRDKEFKIFNGLFHILYDDPEKDEVVRHLLTWLRDRFPEPPGEEERVGVRLYSL